MRTPRTQLEAFGQFADPEVAFEFAKRLRWPDGVVTCPFCNSAEKHAFTKTRKLWQCKDCGKQFSVKKGSIFEDSPMGLDKWMAAIWLIANAKNGISSMEIHRALGITQKSAWFMLHRIRLAMKEGFTPVSLKGKVEVDESYIGGKVGNIHKSKRTTNVGRKATAAENKTAVLGMLERDGKIITEVVRDNKRSTLLQHLQNNIDVETIVYTDKLHSYDALHKHWPHESVDHSVEYVSGDAHTNGLENFWSLFKRTTRGTYVSMEPIHLQRYLDEYCFRFNNRKATDADRFEALTGMIAGKRLTYAELIGKVLAAA